MTDTMADAPLILAVPSKGRLQENAAAFFAGAGLSFVQARGARDYRGSIAGIADAEVRFLSAGEITAQLAAGGAHLGITGEDLVRESIANAETAIELIAPLGFGHADVVVAVPRAWIDVATMADLDDVAADLHHRHGRRMRVATKYVNLTRRFFATHGIADYQVVESNGATEAAPAAGTAEIIVDITTTGTTLAANGLKVLDDGVMLKSSANLVGSLQAPWSAAARRAASAILSRIAAAEAARSLREIRAGTGALDPEAIADIARRHGGDLPFGPGAGLAVIHCTADDAAGLAEALVARGAGPVSVSRLDYVFRGDNPLAAKLFGRLPPAP